VRPAGRREVPGRPLIYATTAEFLTHFGLASRKDLPGLDDLKAAGLLDPVDLVLDQMELEDEIEEAATVSAEQEFAGDDGVLLENQSESA
jgi:segregation and condensation protein B